MTPPGDPPVCKPEALFDAETLAPAAPPSESPTMAPSAADGLGIPGYEILGELGRGGMGVVYKARQTRLNRVVALKMILAGGHAGEADLARFRTEAEAIARLQHPNIVQVFEVGEHNDLPYFSLEFCGGGSLERKLGGTPLSPREAAALVGTLARAMQAAHGQHVIHRDLKPANVLLAEDATPKITDFGLAKKLDEAGRTASGAIVGTPSYMAPEQAGDKTAPVGPASDVYALGAILYECLTGRPPFKAATALDTVLQVVGEEPVPPRRLVPKLPRDLETICLKCLEKVPGKRYGTAADLADDLQRWLNTQPIRARRIGPVGRAARWCRRNPLLAGVSVLAVVVSLTLSGIYYAGLKRENRRTREALGQAEQEREQARDTVARSLYEQARALRLSRQPGWRWQALELLRDAEGLRARPRREDLPPVEETAQHGPSSRLPTRGEMRREVAAALLLGDARPRPPVRIAATVGMAGAISDDGSRALAAFAEWSGKLAEPARAGLRLFDLSDGRRLAEWVNPSMSKLPFALRPDGSLFALGGLNAPGQEGVQLFDLPAGGARARLPAPKVPSPPLVWNSYNVLAFSPDGRYLAASRGDGKKSDLFLWDLREPAASRHLARADVPVYSLCFRPDGPVLAYPAGGSKLALVDLQGRAEPKLVELPLPVAPQDISGVQGVRLSGDRLAWAASSPVLAVACTNAGGKVAILFWGVDRQAPLARWDTDFDTKMLRLALSPGGKRLAVGHADGAIRLYDVAARGESLRLEDAHPGGVGMLRWLPDGRLLSADTMGNSYTVWELSGPPLSSVPVAGGEPVGDLAFSPDGRHLAVLRRGARPAAVLVERTSGRVSHELAVPADLNPTALCFRPDGQQLVVVNPRVPQAVVWDLPGRREKTYSLAGRAGWLPQSSRPAFLADGRLLVVVQHRQGSDLQLVVRDLVSGTDAGPGVAAKLSQEIWFLATMSFETQLSGDGRWLAGLPGSMSPSREPITIWEVPSGRRAGELSLPDLGLGVKGMMMAGLSGDGKWLYHTSLPPDYMQNLSPSRVRLRVWDVADRRLHWDLPFSGDFSTVTLSPDGRLLGVGYENGSVELWDVPGRDLLFRWRPVGAGALTHLTFTPDAAFLAASGARGPVHLLQLAEVRRQLARTGLDW
jgi:WD40 repeat protein